MPTLTFPGSKSPDGSVNSSYPDGDKDASLLADYDFVQRFPSTSAYGSSQGGSITLEDGYMRMNYPADSVGGAVFNWLTVSVLNETHVGLRFKARLLGSPAKFGPKFLKFFGQVDGVNETANTTFAMVYGSSEMEAVSFGDGTTTSNDTQNTVRLDGTFPSWAGRSWGNGAVISAPQSSNFIWDDNWHEFEILCKFNSGTTSENEVNDGEYLVRIDGDTYMHATGLFNRHYSNKPLSTLHFGDWSQGATNPFTLDITDIKVASGGLPS